MLCEIGALHSNVYVAGASYKCSENLFVVALLVYYQCRRHMHVYNHWYVRICNFLTPGQEQLHVRVLFLNFKCK